MIADVPAILLETALAGTAAMVLVLLLRTPVRMRFGSGATYALWWLLPVAMVATLLPARIAPTATASVATTSLLPQVVGGVEAGTVAIDDLLLWGWIAGALAVALMLLWQQWLFHARLGRVERLGNDLRRAQAQAGLPAVTGVLRPRIVLPSDFAARYSAEEQRLVLQHERIHLRRGDLQANAALALLRCLHWFNPLLHYAADRFRQDQELACDESVIRRHPHSRRVYGAAMLKTQLADSALPFGCHWHGQHPLKERIAMLKRPTPTPRQWLTGALACTLLATATGFSVWAAQPARPASEGGSATRPADTRQADEPVATGHAAANQPAQDHAASRMTRTPPPQYPADALANKVSGQVVLIVHVAADGSVKDVQVETSEPAGVFDASAIAAAKDWTFNPARENGRPVEGRVRVPIRFDAESEAWENEPPPPAEAADINRATYDWIEMDTREAGAVKELVCDVIQAKAGSGIVYCGIRKEAATQS